MKKSTLAAAVAAATLSIAAHAQVTTITPGVQLVINPLPSVAFDIAVPCPAGSTTFSIGGVNTSQVQMLGNVCLDPTGSGSPLIRLGFHTVTGDYSATAIAPYGIGTVFGRNPAPAGGGSIQIDVQTTSGWVPYGTVTVNTTNLDCTDLGPGLNGAAVTGLQITGGTTINVPGFWNGNTPDATEARAICRTNLFMQDAYLFIQ